MERLAISVGLTKKVVAADKEGAEIFFAPNNPVSKEEKKANPKAKSNYETAKKQRNKFIRRWKLSRQNPSRRYWLFEEELEVSC